MAAPTATDSTREASTRALGEELVRLIRVMVSMRPYLPDLHPGVDASHTWTLVAIARGEQRVSDLAGCVHSDISTVSRQVTHLCEQGLAEKRPDPSDGRAQVVALTALGRAALERIRESRRQWLDALLDDWTDTEVADLTHGMQRLTDAVTDQRDRLAAR